MASGDLLALFAPLGYEPPATNYATVGARNSHPYLAFDPTTQEGACWTGVMPPNYGGGDLAVSIVWIAATATTGSVVWDSTFERINDAGPDLDADDFATAQVAAAAAAPAASGQTKTTTIAHTAGAAGTDSIAAGDPFRLRVRRVAADAGDGMAGDAQVVLVYLKEA